MEQDSEHIVFVEQKQKPTHGTAGIKCHLPRCATTIGNASVGGIKKGNFIFRFDFYIYTRYQKSLHSKGEHKWQEY